jgi:hypothetical protein
LNGQSYIGEHDFNTVSNLAKCPADADDRILFKLAVAFAKRKIEGKEEGSR